MEDVVGDVHEDEPPLAVRADVVDAALAVLPLTLVVEVTRLVDQRPAHAGVVRVLEEHWVAVGEDAATPHVDLTTASRSDSSTLAI